MTNVRPGFKTPEGGWLPGIRGYLQQMNAIKEVCGVPTDWKFQSVEGLILHYGRTFEPTVKADWDPSWSVERGPKNDCFKNTLLACLWDDWSYAEGYAQSSILPCLHAWNWKPSHPNLAIDLTWDDGVASEYFGVAFDSAWIKRTAIDSGYYGIFGGEQLEVIKPLLRDGIPQSALSH